MDFACIYYKVWTKFSSRQPYCVSQTQLPIGSDVSEPANHDWWNIAKLNS